MTDRDDALRRDLGWTGPEESDYEPESKSPKPPPAPPPPPRRPPVDFVPPRPTDDTDPTAVVPPQPIGTSPSRVALEATGERAAQGGPSEPPPAPFRDPDRPRDSFREQPAQQGPSPYQAPRPPAGPEPAPWPLHPPGPPPPVPPGPSAAPPAQQQWRGPSRPDAAAPPPATYADRIRATHLVPAPRVEPGRGWRRLLYRATFGLVNLGPSADETRQAELEAKIKGVLRGHYKVGVMGKGGVGKTTVSASVGSVFAELRQEDRVVAIDADTAFGKLGSRVDPRAQGSYWELASDQHLDSFADIRGRVGNNAAGLFVLAGESSPARRRVLEPAIYREATTRLDRYFSISIVDCSSTMDSPVTQEVLRDLDALLVVSSPWVDGAAAAGQTLDWLANRGMGDLLRRTVVVLNDSDGHADKRTRSVLAQQFAGQGQVVIEVPFDGHLRPGGVIDRTSAMSAAARRRFVEIAAALAEHFPTQDERIRDRR